jgi:hypothetical protein
MTEFPPAPPRIEARVESLERLSLIMHARIVELSQDMLASFRQAAESMTTKEDLSQMEERFNTKMDALTAEMRDKFEQVITLLTHKPE